MRLQLLSASIAASLLAACGQQAGDDTAPPSASNQSAGQAEAPPAAAGGADLVYPGAQGGADSFTTPDPIDKVVAHYWAGGPVQQRGGVTWTVSKPEKSDAGYLLNITTVNEGEGQSHVIYLNPAAGGGTEGRVRVLTDEEIRSGVKL